VMPAGGPARIEGARRHNSEEIAAWPHHCRS
jgi:hypothetical protein